MDVDAFAVPGGQAMNGERVAQIVGPWTYPPAPPLHAQLPQEMTHGVRCASHGNCAPISADEDGVAAAAFLGPQNVGPLGPVLPKLVGQIRPEGNESTASFALANMQYAGAQIDILTSQPHGLAETQPGAVGRENEQTQQAGPKVTSLMAAGGFDQCANLLGRENVRHVMGL